MIKRFIIAILLLGLVGGGLVGFNLFRDKMIAEFLGNMPVTPATVSTVTAEPSVWSPVIDAIGTANAAQGVELTVEATGIVKEIGFAANQRVTRGDRLLQLDDAVQRADLEAARTQAELDQRSFERAQALQARGVSTGVSLEISEAAAVASQATVAKLEAVLEQKRLVAPFDGTIGIPRVDLGQYVAPGTIIATLQDLATMRVDFTVPEQRLGQLGIGQKVGARAEGFAEMFEGEISGIDPKVDPSSRLVAVRATLSNPAGRLTPGQFVRISVQLPEEEGVFALPQNAVVTSLYGDHVYVVRPKEEGSEELVARQVFVQVGRRSGGLAEILTGVQAGDVVVTAGQNRLTSGGPVVIDNTINPGGPSEPPAPAPEPAAADEAPAGTPPAADPAAAEAAPERTGSAGPGAAEAAEAAGQ